MLHQSEVYFERCHAADLDTRRTTAERLECWSAWIEHYRDGVSVGRARHAARRVEALRAGDQVSVPLPDGSAAPFTVAIFALSSGGVAAEPSEAASAEAGAPLSGAVTPAADLGVAPDLAPAVAAGPTEASPPQAAPASPESERAPPPRARPAPRVITPPRMASPSHPCNSVCEPAWTRCLERSADRATEELEACRSEYRVCMRGCL